MHDARGLLERMQAPLRRFRSAPSRKWVLLSRSRAPVPDSFEAGELTNGRHRVDVDQRSWHLPVVDKDDHVCRCVRYHAHFKDTAFSQLNVSRSARAHSEHWGEKRKAAVESEIALSRRLDLPCVVSGGWARIEELGLPKNVH